MCVHRSFACLVFSSLFWPGRTARLVFYILDGGLFRSSPWGSPAALSLSLHVLLLAASREKKKLYLSCFPTLRLAGHLLLLLSFSSPSAHGFSWTFVRFLLYFVVLVSLFRALFALHCLSLFIERQRRAPSRSTPFPILPVLHERRYVPFPFPTA